jgi:RNA-binding protein 26
MKLDNRPRKLLVKDVGSDSVQAVRDWYETGGQVDAVETLENGDVTVTFRTRAAAEQVRFTMKKICSSPLTRRSSSNP